MAISHILGKAAADVSHFLGTVKANVSAILGTTASFGGGGSGDADVDAFITATGISDPTIEAAILDLVTDLKSDGIWAKCTAIYPFVGGTAATHLVNLKNPGTYNITWSGTVTHNANGVTSNGTTGYGNTGMNAQSVLSKDDAHFAVYSRTDVNETRSEMGAGGALANQRVMVTCRFVNLYITQIGVDASQTSPASSDARGMIMATRRSSTDMEVYRNGTSLQTKTNSNASGNMPNMNIYVLCSNENGTAASFSTKNLAFASIGSGLSDAEVSTYYTRVQAFQTDLSRNV